MRSPLPKVPSHFIDGKHRREFWNCYYLSLEAKRRYEQFWVDMLGVWILDEAEKSNLLEELQQLTPTEVPRYMYFEI